MNLYQKLLEVKKRVPYLKKDTEGFKYNYADPETVLGTINPILNELGIVIVPEVKEILPTPMDNAKKEVLYTVLMNYRIINSENPEESIVIPWGGTGVNGDEKGYGSALTYAERYFYLKLFQIATGEDDPDAIQAAPKSKVDDSKSNAGANYYKVIQGLIKEGKITTAQVQETVKRWGGDSWLTLSNAGKESVYKEIWDFCK